MLRKGFEGVSMWAAALLLSATALGCGSQSAQTTDPAVTADDGKGDRSISEKEPNDTLDKANKIDLPWQRTTRINGHLGAHDVDVFVTPETDETIMFGYVNVGDANIDVQVVFDDENPDSYREIIPTVNGIKSFGEGDGPFWVVITNKSGKDQDYTLVMGQTDWGDDNYPIAIINEPNEIANGEHADLIPIATGQWTDLRGKMDKDDVDQFQLATSKDWIYYGSVQVDAVDNPDGSSSEPLGDIDLEVRTAGGTLLGNISTDIKWDNGNGGTPHTVTTFRIVKDENTVLALHPQHVGDAAFQNKSYHIWLTKVPRNGKFEFPTWY